MLPDGLLPYSEVDTDNAIFQQKWHHLRWLNSEARLRRYTRIVLIGLPALIILWWLLERLHLNWGIVSPDLNSRLINLIVYVALAVMMLTSVYSLPRIMGRFNAQFNSTYWDMLRLTPQYNTAILMSHDAIAQLRLWPLIIIEMSLRIAIVCLFVLNNLYSVLGTRPLPSDAIIRFVLSPIGFGVWSIILSMGGVFILEPAVRARLIVAFHLAIATRIRNVPLALLAGATMLIILHCVQLVLALLVWALYQALTTQPTSGIGLFLCFFPLTVWAVWMLWRICRWLRHLALNFTYDFLFRQD